MSEPHSTIISVAAVPEDIAKTLMQVVRQESVALHFFEPRGHFLIYMEVKKPKQRKLRCCSRVFHIQKISKEFWETLQQMIQTMIEQHLTDKDLLGYVSARIVREDVFLPTPYHETVPDAHVGFYLHFFYTNVEQLPGGKTCMLPQMP